MGSYGGLSQFPTQSVGNALLLIIVLVFSFFILIIYMRLLTKAYTYIGLPRGTASMITILSLLLSPLFIPIAIINGKLLGVSIGGCIIPLAVSIYLMKKRLFSLGLWLPLFVISAFISYLVSFPTTTGIVSPFPLFLIPPFITALFAYFSSLSTRENAAALSYSAQVFGALVGGDILHLPALLSMHLPPHTYLVIGGAGVFDMIYLSGLIAVGIEIGMSRAHITRKKHMALSPEQMWFIEYERDLERRLLGQKLKSPEEYKQKTGRYR